MPMNKVDFEINGTLLMTRLLGGWNPPSETCSVPLKGVVACNSIFRSRS